MVGRAAAAGSPAAIGMGFWCALFGYATTTIHSHYTGTYFFPGLTMSTSASLVWLTAQSFKTQLAESKRSCSVGVYTIQGPSAGRCLCQSRTPNLKP